MQIESNKYFNSNPFLEAQQLTSNILNNILRLMRSTKDKIFSFSITRIVIVVIMLIMLFLAFRVGRNYQSFQDNLNTTKKLSVECLKQLYSK